MSTKNLNQAQKVLEVFSRHNISPSIVGTWVGSVKNLIINTAVNLPESGVVAVKEDMQLSKEATDFLEDLQVALED
jgi:hypothetical protein